jgi:hypothetical protein
MSDDVLDWRTEAHRHGTHPMHVWIRLQHDWPRNSMWNIPKRPADVDKLARDPDMHPRIRQAINDAATATKADT